MIRRYQDIYNRTIIDGAATATLIRGDDYVTPGSMVYTSDGKCPVSFIATIASLYGVPMRDLYEYNGLPCGPLVALGFPMTTWPMRDALVDVQRFEYATRADGSRYTWGALTDMLSAFYGAHRARAGMSLPGVPDLPPDTAPLPSTKRVEVTLG